MISFTSKSTPQMYTGTTFLTTYTKYLLHTIFASDMVLKVDVHAGTNMFSS
jgi:hypothetical protein